MPARIIRPKTANTEKIIENLKKQKLKIESNKVFLMQNMIYNNYFNKT